MARLKLFLILLSFFIGLQSAQAQDSSSCVNTKKLASLVINDAGRVKPLETFANYYLLRLSGKTNYKGLNATQWLSKALFKPDSVFGDKVFLINNPEILEAIGVPPDTKRRYSFSELEAGEDKLNEFAQVILLKDPKQLTDFDREIVRVFTNYQSLIQVFDTFSLFINHPDFQVSDTATQKLLNLTRAQNSVFDILQVSNKLHSSISGIQQLAPTTEFKPSQQVVLRLSLALYRWLEGHKEFQNAFSKTEKLSLIPTTQEQWLSPWELFGSKTDFDKQELFALQKIYLAYHTNNQQEFDSSLDAYKALINTKITELKIPAPQTALELAYNRLKPFGWAQFLYLVSLIVSVIAMIKHSSPLLMSFLDKKNLWLVYSGFGLHAFGILARCIILQRAPVSNLYESFIFVAFVSVLLGLALNVAYKNNLSNPGILLANISGFLLLLVSSKFAVEGDTMQVLIAVLNSNFWLSTHVICITIGYAGTFSAGVIGHIYLIQKYKSLKLTAEASSSLLEDQAQELKKLTIMIYAILGFGLCFSFLGTMLGGIWADQSWGRFWGWDPKENGALLIVLWTATVFHARLAGLIKETGLAVGSVIGSMVVMISWFGVNLLGVGLHSYGFTSGVASYLFGYLLLETLFLTWFWVFSPKSAQDKTLKT